MHKFYFKTNRMKKLIFVFALAVLAAVSFSTAHAQTSGDAPFVPSGKFSMQFFADYDYMLAADTGGMKTSSVPKGGTYYTPIDPKNANGQGNIWQKFYQAFDIRRVYLGYDYQMSKDVSAQLLLSHENGTLINNATILTTGTTATYDSVKKTVTIVPGKTTATLPTSSSGDIVLDGNRGLYLKAANVQFKNWIPMSTVIFGQQGTAVFGVAEALWGYRSIEKTVGDMRGIAQSNDLGIQLKGNFDPEKAYSYSVMISNGNGAKQENDKFKKVAIDLNGGFLDKHLWVDAYFDIMGHSDSSNNTTIKLTAGYTMDIFTVGLEYAMQTLAKQSTAIQTTNTQTDATPTGISIFARASLIDKQLMVFARYDMYDPDSKATGSNITNSAAASWKENFIVAGLDWQPDASVNAHIMPNIWMNTYKDKSTGTTALPVITDRAGVTVARMTFAYKF